MKGGMTIQHLLHRAFWCKLLVENGTLQSDALIFEILEISFATTNHLIPPPPKKARDPLIPNMSADWTPRFVHPLSAARCRWPSKVSEDLDPTKLDRMYNTECPAHPPVGLLGFPPGSGSWVCCRNSCVVFFSFATPQMDVFQENTDECEVISCWSWVDSDSEGDKIFI